jgi:uncharacterized FlaG/YvyC family protein
VKATLNRVTEHKVGIRIVDYETEEAIRQIPGEDFSKWLSVSQDLIRKT